MKKLSIFVCLLCLFVTAPALGDFYGGRVNYNRINGYYSGNGGEFTLSSDGGLGLLLDLSAYSSLTKNQIGPTGLASFQTFCVETGEYVAQPMDIVVSTTSAEGISNSHAILGGEAVGDDLDPRTAYFYTQFATGNLSGYAYSGTVDGLNRAETAGALQRLIWWIEEEGGLLAANNTFQNITLSFDQADLIQAWLYEYTSSGWTGIGDVRILNTYNTTNGDRAQDQLYLVPVPGAVLLGILGLGAAGLKLRRFA